MPSFSPSCSSKLSAYLNFQDKTLQELQILSSVTLDCQVAEIVMDISDSQLSELWIQVLNC